MSEKRRIILIQRQVRERGLTEEGSLGDVFRWRTIGWAYTRDGAKRIMRKEEDFDRLRAIEDDRIYGYCEPNLLIELGGF